MGPEELEQQAAVIRGSLAKHGAWMRDVRAHEEAKKQAEQACRDREASERQAAKEAELVGTLRRRYLSADPAASEADFQRALPALREEHRRAAVANGVTADDLARRVFRSRYRG